MAQDQEFEFVIEEVIEVTRSPYSMVHHWTMLYGKVTHGVISVRAPIRVPDIEGLDTPARIGGIEMGPHGRLQPDKVEAPSELITVMTMHLPAKGPKVVRGGIALPCSPEERDQLILAMLQRDPSRIFHPFSSSWPNDDCPDCANVASFPEAIPYLEGIIKQGDPYLSRRIRTVLEKLSKNDT